MSRWLLAAALSVLCVVAASADQIGTNLQGVGSATDTASHAIAGFPAPGIGFRNCITGIILGNIDASNNTLVTIQDGSGGPALAYVPAADNAGGAVVTLLNPICGSNNTATYFASGTGASTLYLTMVGYKKSFP